MRAGEGGIITQKNHGGCRLHMSLHLSRSFCYVLTMCGALPHKSIGENPWTQNEDDDDDDDDDDHDDYHNKDYNDNDDNAEDDNDSDDDKDDDNRNGAGDDDVFHGQQSQQGGLKLALGQIL